MLLTFSPLFDPYLLLPQSGAMGTGLFESVDQNSTLAKVSNYFSHNFIWFVFIFPHSQAVMENLALWMT